MNGFFEQYNKVIGKAETLRDSIISNRKTIDRLSNELSGGSSARINNLNAQLEKIDDYLLRIKSFQDLALRHLESMNVSSVEAPEGYRVNINRLRKWADRIDPMSTNDPYAQRVYIVSKCDELFLEGKKKEFIDRIEQLKRGEDAGTTEELRKLNLVQKSLISELSSYAESDEIKEFAQFVKEENNKYRYGKMSGISGEPVEESDSIAPGAYGVSMPFLDEQDEILKSLFDDCYDAERKEIKCPVIIGNKSEYILSVTCTPDKRKELDRGIQNLILESIFKSRFGSRKIYIWDAVRYNTSSLGKLKSLENSAFIGNIPRNPEQLTHELEKMLSQMADIEEIIEKYDAVTEYNSEVDEVKKVTLSTIVLFGWPNSFTGHDRELVQRMMTNYERFGFSFILVNFRNSEKEDEERRQATPEYARENALNIKMLHNDESISLPNGKENPFHWYLLDDSADIKIDVLNDYKVKGERLGNEYTKRVDISRLNIYDRKYKGVELPVGIDGKDRMHSISFENENFATYLVGASRSGKSTLIHTIITGLISNYHPDSLELWLADFKQVEFKRYIDNPVPHIKYVLLDESRELVYDMINKLTAEMIRRQRLIARKRVQRVDQIKEFEEPVPIIFVIFDEFSIMSQAIAENETYKLKLQNLLAKGAALGIKFLFASQTFTSGVSGLTTTARAQIQQRIAMKGTVDEISSTLELSSNTKTERVKNWMDSLPPHYALVKYKPGADSVPEVKRLYVLYFKDYDDQKGVIKRLNSELRSVEKYDETDLHSYVNKNPVYIEGNSYSLFDHDLFDSIVEKEKKENAVFVGDDNMFLSFGVPRLMERMKVTSLSSETRENILLVGRDAERACTVSIILSIITALSKQNCDVQLWTYDRNPIFLQYRELLAKHKVELVVGTDNIINKIKLISDNIDNASNIKHMIIMLGMDRVTRDFDLYTGKTEKEEEKENTAELEAVMNKGMAKTSEQILESNMRKAWATQKSGYEQQGLSPEEIRNLKIQFKENYIKEWNMPEPEPKSESKNENTVKKYDPSNDFRNLIKLGGRSGYHFMLHVNSYSDIKEVGIKSDYFRYRMAFQISSEDSSSLFGNGKIASSLPEHVCEFYDTLEYYSFRPYLHEGLEWDGWSVENNVVVNPFE